jgi:hypothetical protein
MQGNGSLPILPLQLDDRRVTMQIEGGKFPSHPVAPYHKKKKILHKSQPVKTVPEARGNQKKVLLLINL